MRFIRHSLLSIITMLLFFISSLQPVFADIEQQIKAAFIVNFIKFTSWPEPYDIASQREISICILGTNTLQDAQALFEKGSSANLAIRTKFITTPPQEAGQCHIIFISDSNYVNAATSLSAQNKALTVSDVKGFASAGGMIGFVKEENKIRLYINKTAVENAGLKVDAQLLEIARKVLR